MSRVYSQVARQSDSSKRVSEVLVALISSFEKISTQMLVSKVWVVSDI